MEIEFGHGCEGRKHCETFGLLQSNKCYNTW